MTTEQQTELVWRPLDLHSTPAWSELTAVLAIADRTEESYSAQALAEELTAVGTDPDLDTVAVWDGDRLVAVGQVRVRFGLDRGRAKAFLGGGVHPDYRGQGIGHELIDRLERRAVELASVRHPGREVCLAVSAGLPGDPVRPMLEHRGYQLVRYFHGMRLPLPAGPLPDPQQPTEAYRPEFDGALLTAYNDSFSTHFGFTAREPAEWAHELSSSTFRPDCSVLIAVGEGTVQAFVLTFEYVEGELYIGIVGTIRSARGQGLARACLVEAVRAGTAAGYRSASLDVDSANPTGAGALYESVGFAITDTYAAYDLIVPAGAR